MPMLNILTNVKTAKLLLNVCSELTDIISVALNKHRDVIFVSVQHVESLTFQGNNQPAAVVELKSIGFANKEKVVADLTKYLDQNFKIPSSRIAITLVDLHPTNVAVNGQLKG